MKRYLIHRDGRLIGGIECGPATARMLRQLGYTLLAA